jgi:hypothetical protein
MVGELKKEPALQRTSMGAPSGSQVFALANAKNMGLLSSEFPTSNHAFMDTLCSGVFLFDKPYIAPRLAGK